MCCPRMIFINLFVLCYFVYNTNSARILAIFPTPAYSHQASARTLLLELNSRGHELTVLTTDPLNEQAPKNYKEINLNYLYKHINRNNWSNAMAKNRLKSMLELFLGWDMIVEDIYAKKEVKDLIQNSHFDLVILEWSTHASLTAFSEHFNCPLVGFRSLGLRVEAHDVLANPVTPSYISVAFMDFRDDFIGRLVNTVTVLSSRLLYCFVALPRAEKIAKKYFPNHAIHVKNLEKNVSLILTYTNHVIMGVRPVVPSVVEIGGMHLKTKMNDLPENIKKFLDTAEQGAILFSLGSLIFSAEIPQEKINILAETFAELPYNIILKLDKNPFDKKVKNVLCVKWLPQESILGHPNLRLFISHGGLYSLWESVFNHIPLIGIPFHTDQFYNIHRVEELGIGLKVDYQKLTKSVLLDSIYEVINNQSYKQRTIEVAKIIKDQPFSPKQKAIWWIEYVLRNKGAPHFKSKAVGMNWFIYYSLDVICFIILFILIVFYILYKILKCIRLIICSNSDKKKQQ